jgi:hypothetical protein
VGGNTNGKDGVEAGIGLAVAQPIIESSLRDGARATLDPTAAAQGAGSYEDEP